MVKDEMNIETSPNDLDQSHRIRGNIKTEKKERRIIKFVRDHLRHDIFKKNKLLKGTGLSITESLTKDRMAKTK